MSNKIGRALVWFIGNGIFATCLYLGYFKKIDWAINLFIFAFWLSVSCTMIIYGVEEASKVAKKKGRSVHKYISGSYDIGIIIVLAALGHFVLASFWFIQAIAEHAMYDSTK